MKQPEDSRLEYCWINKAGEKIPVETMGTLYLFNTIRCIYNNLINKENPYIAHHKEFENFGIYSSWRKEHTKEYVVQIFCYMVGVASSKTSILIPFKTKGGTLFGESDYPKELVELDMLCEHIRNFVKDNPNWRNFVEIEAYS